MCDLSTMRLERLPEYLTTAVVTLLGMAIALYCGRLTGQGQTSMLALILTGGFCLAVCLQLRAQIWIFIPLAWVFTGRVPILPLPFAVRDLAVMGVCAVFFALIALKVVRRKPTYDRLDLLLCVLVLLIVAAFIRNPTGTYAMGSDRVGGKPYFDVAVGVAAYLVLCRASLLPRWASIMPLLFGATGIIQGLLTVIALKLPWTIPYFAQFYTGIGVNVDGGTEIGGAVEGRQGHLAGIAESLALTLCSFFRPLTLISPVHWGRLSLFLLASFCALQSGHRTSVISISMFFFLGSYFRRGAREVIHFLTVGIPLLGVLLFLQGTVLELPLAAQRALSFLPAQWNYQATDDAEGSVQWRVEMWKLALTTDQYIQNKIFGDGFGYSLREYERMLSANSVNFAQASQENALRQGAFHSGPVGTIRVVGVVGFLVFVMVLVVVARRAAKLIRRSENTPFYIFSLYLGIPLIIEPFKFVFIFGSFESGLPHVFFTTGLLRLLAQSLDEYENSQSSTLVNAKRVPLRSSFASRRRREPASILKSGEQKVY